MEGVEIVVVVDDPIREREGRAKLLARRVRAVLLPLARRKLRERLRIAGPRPHARPRKAQFGRCVHADEDESGRAAEGRNLCWIPDRIDDVAPAQTGNQPLRENTEPAVFPKERTDPDEMFALGGESARGGLLANDVGEGMNRKTSSPQVGRDLTLARGVGARDAQNETHRLRAYWEDPRERDRFRTEELEGSAIAVVHPGPGRGGPAPAARMEA